MLGGAGAADGFGEIVGFAQGRASSPACREVSGGVGWRQSDGVEVHRAHPDACFSDSLCPGVVLREEGGEEEVPFHTRDLRIRGVWYPCAGTSPLWTQGRGVTVGCCLPVHTLRWPKQQEFLPPSSGGQGPGPGCRRG